MRRCVATMEMCAKNDLLRIVRTPEGEIVVDPTGKKNGRGAYLKKTKEALDIARKKKSLDRAFETKVPSTVYDEIARYIREE